jgi:hypothetical protein
MAASMSAPGPRSNEGKTEIPVEFVLTNQNSSQAHAGLDEVSNGNVHIAEKDGSSIL